MLNDVFSPPEKLYLWMKMNDVFSRILCPLTKQKNAKIVARACPRFDSPPAQTSIHWTINCGQWWRNVFAPRSAIIESLNAAIVKVVGEILLAMICESIDGGANVWSTVCKQKVVILSNDCSNVLFEILFKFLENFVSIFFIFAFK